MDTADHVGLTLKVYRAIVESGLPATETYTVYQKSDGIHEYFIKGEIGPSVESDPTYAYVGHNGRAEVIVCGTLGEHYEKVAGSVAAMCEKKDKSSTLPPS